MILSIDPGINFTGITLGNYIDKKLVIEQTYLINNSGKITIEEKKYIDLYDGRVPKVLKIIDFINDLMGKYKIERIVIEGPFYNGLRPQAYSALLEVLNSIKYIICIPVMLPFNIIEPLSIKKVFSNKYLAKKEEMLQALLEHIKNNNIILNKDIESLSEHEIDSIAIAYSYFNLN